MRTLLVDSSVLVKWFHDEPGPQQAAARRIREAVRTGTVEARIIDLAVYEVGNVLLRRLGWSGDDVARQLDLLTMLCGAPLSLDVASADLAAHLGHRHGLSFYDASWAAVARSFDVPLVSADELLVGAGLAALPSAVVAAL